MENNKNGLSIIEAFMALEDLDDLYESKSFSLNDKEEVEQAQEYKSEIDSQQKETELQVIDVDADSLEHLKDNKGYIGQAIIQCNACKATRFIDLENLESSESDNELYNIGEECPYCHSDFTGYSLIGQVGKMVEEEPEIDNDEKVDDEPSIENDVEDEIEPEDTLEDTEEDQEEEQESSDNLFDEDEEQDYMETDLEDDTEEDNLSESFGTVYDQDDVEWDDTEEYTPIHEDIKEDVLENVDLDYEEDKIIIEEIEDIKEYTLGEYIKDVFIQPSKLKEIIIKDSFNNNILFKGDYDDLNKDLLDSTLVTFETCGDKLVVNVDKSENDPNRYFNYLVGRYCTNKDFVEVYDVASTDLLAAGSINNVINFVQHYTVVGIETPKYIEIKILNNSNIKVLNEAKEDLSDEDLLIHEIINKNGGEVYKIFRPGTWENVLTNNIKNGEELDHVFNSLILPLKDEVLVRLFKDVTGYLDDVDEALNKLGMKLQESNVVFKDKKEVKEDYEYHLLNDLINKYRYEYNKDNHEDIWFDIVSDYDSEELANDVLAALEDDFDGHELLDNDIFEEEMNDKIDEDYEPLLRVEYVYWFDEEGNYGTSTTYTDLESCKNACIDNNGYSVEKQVTEIDEEGNPISDMEASEIWFNPDHDPSRAGDDVLEELDQNKEQEVISEEHFLVSDKLGKKEVETIFECKDRKELSERITEARNNKQPYKVQRSDKEGYRYTVILESNSLVKTSSNVTKTISDEDKEIVKKICRISKDICDSIENHYNIEVDPRFVVSDIIQDLRLISGDLDVNELESTPLNQLTSYLYKAYDGFSQYVHDTFNVRRDRARELSMALKALDSEQFTPQAIDNKINSRILISS